MFDYFPVLSLHVSSLKKRFSKFSKFLKFFSFIGSFRNAGLFSLNTSVLILIASTGTSMGLIPVAVATTVAGLNALAFKHYFFPSEKDDDIDMILKAAEKFYKFRKIPQHTIRELSGKSCQQLPVDESDFFEVPYNSGPGGKVLMYKDLNAFKYIFGKLPLKTTDDVKLSVDEIEKFNNFFASSIKRFFEDVKPFENKVFISHIDFVIKSIEKNAVTPDEAVFYLCGKLHTKYADYIDMNLFKFHPELLDEWSYDDYLNFLKWLMEPYGLINSPQFFIVHDQLNTLYQSSHSNYIAKENNVDADLAETLDSLD